MSVTTPLTQSHQAGTSESRARLAASDPSHINSIYLLDRLSHLRTILPVFAQELAVARRQVTSLQAENGGLQQMLLAQMQPQAPLASLSLSKEEQA